ncbi:hypothetical protein [Paracoccus marcusii]|uniref:Uncharacterized protein n=1 Tax=Paracoccus marcusii TaxID=59779 RepID=A0ABY7UPQ8_9RHOB|nr:hypothetical protein [Paracoccus marcusii]WDA11588.1 hypothetical protein PRL19_09765 [Paracoccus marcusii]
MSNTLVVGLFAGCMIGFILSMLAGAFGVGTIQAVPPWLQGVFSGFATFVSIYAVYLVSETLRATGDTLSATQDMAKQQAETNIAQTRAWLHVHDFGYEANEETFHEGEYEVYDRIWVSLRNFGNTPALNVSVNKAIKFYSGGADDAANSKHDPFLKLPSEPVRFSAVPPEKNTKTIYFAFPSSEWPRQYEEAVFELEVTYLVMPSRGEIFEKFRFKFCFYEDQAWLELQ